MHSRTSLLLIPTIPLLVLACVPEGGDGPGGDFSITDFDSDSDAFDALPEVLVSASGVDPDDEEPERWDADVPVVLPPWWKCGDGELDSWEQCDNGGLNSEYGECTPKCQEPWCGDGYHHPSEECDLGPANGQQLNVYGSCSASCEIATGCGDGVVQPDYLEECDHGAGGSPTCAPNCRWYRRVVFVTAETYTGAELGGTAGADGLCQDSAKNGGLPFHESFRAWLGVKDDNDPDDQSANPSSWLKPVGEDNEFMRMDGLVVAESVHDLLNNDLLNPIQLTAAGENLGGVPVWSNILPGGTYASEYDCDNWTSDSGFGRWGTSGSTTSTWTDSGMKLYCNNALHLYCVEQPGNGN